LILLLSAVPVLAQEVTEQEAGYFTTSGLTKSLSISGQDSLVIRSAKSLRGKISIKVGEPGRVELVFYKRARTESRSRAIDFIDLVDATLSSLPGYVRLELRAPNPPPWESGQESGMIDCELTLPPRFFVDAEVPFYDVDAIGPLRGVVAEESLGRLAISDIDGVVRVATANNRLSLENIRGVIVASTSNSTLIARDLVARGETAVIRNDQGEIDIEGFTGELNLKNSFGATTIREFRPTGESNFIRGRLGPVSIEIVEMGSSQILVNNWDSDVELTVPDSLSAYFSLAVDDTGLIEVYGLEFTTDLVERDRLSLSSGSEDAEIVASVRGKGNIYIRGIEGD
jgi:hypothetical protein